MLSVIAVRPGEVLNFGSTLVAQVHHSETREVFNLVAVLTERRISVFSPLDENLQPGLIRHRGNQRLYALNRIVELPEGVQAVWYTGLYEPEGNFGPHWVRPFHTSDGKGFLDPVDDTGLMRFERIRERAVELNPMRPATFDD